VAETPADAAVAWRFFRPSMARHLFSDGMAFLHLLPRHRHGGNQLLRLAVGRIGRPVGRRLYGVFISLTIMQLGFVVMLSTPTWPAVAEALARGDLPWARTAAKRLYGYGLAFALCSAAGLVLVGPWVFPIWLGSEFADIGRVLLACYGLYFIAHVWRHLNHAMMIGTGQVSRLAWASSCWNPPSSPPSPGWR
jgi:Na+-driven multidrug efflux pump